MKNKLSRSEIEKLNPSEKEMYSQEEMKVKMARQELAAALERYETAKRDLAETTQRLRSGPTRQQIRQMAQACTRNIPPWV